LSHCANIAIPIDSSDFGKLIFSKLIHPLNAKSSIFFKLSLRETTFKLIHDLNALLSMLSIDSPKIIELRVSLFEKELFPIEMTFIPSILVGIIKDDSLPKYFRILIEDEVTSYS